MKRRSHRNISSIPTASMGDIAFLLIIFFMVCSNFIKESSVQLKPPRALDLIKIKESPTAVAVDKDGAIYLQGRRVPDAEAVEWGVTSLIKDKATEQGRTVLFRCDESINRDVFEPILDAISRGGGIIAAMGDKTKEEKGTP